MKPRIGSLCSGAGMLDRAVEAVFGAETVWHCEINEAASKVLEHRWPGVPNLGDLTTMGDAWDWVEHVDILTGGYPCQPFSHAGQRKGEQDERHIWPDVREAIRRIRPRITILENVAGHRSLGFDRVLGDLAEDGMHVQWTSLRASDIGSCHARDRVFLFVTPDAAGMRGTHQPRCRNQIRQSLSTIAGAGDRDSGRGTAAGVRELERTTDELAAVALLPTPSAADGDGGHLNRSGDLLATPQARDYKGVPSDGFNTANLCRDVRDLNDSWGKYAPAIARWEALTRPAPPPTESNSKGNPRLAPAFSEWMLGWPAGWVTNVPGISRNDQLRIIGNGVVPHQAVAALRWLLNVSEVAA